MSAHRLLRNVTCFVVLLLLAGDSSADTECARSFTPVTSPGFVKNVTVTSGRTWQAMEQLCQRRHPGYDVLQQHYRKLTEDDKEMCGDAIVPLGIERVDRKMFWRNGRGIDMEEVRPEDILLQQTEDSPTFTEGTTNIKDTILALSEDNTKQFGALNITDNKWSLVNEDFNFTCALCQQLRRSSIETPVHPAPPPEFSTSNFIYFTSVASNVNLSKLNTEVMHAGILERLAAAFNTTEANVTYLYSSDADKNHTLNFFHVASSVFVEREALQKHAEKYNFDSVSRADLCLNDNTTDALGNIAWGLKSLGRVSTKHVGSYTTSYLEASRECAYDYSSKKAIWTDVRYWEHDFVRCTIEKEQSKIDEVSNMLQGYAQRPVRSSELKKVLESVDKITDLSFIYHENNFTNRLSLLKEVDNILSNTILESYQDISEVSNSNVALTVASLQETDPLAGVSIDLMEGIKFEKFSLNKTFLRRSTERGLIPSSADIDILFSPALISTHARLGLCVYTNFHSIFIKKAYESNYFAKEIAMQVTLAKGNLTTNTSTSSKDTFFDVHVNSNRSIWSVFKVNEVDWSRTPCHAIRFEKCSPIAFRCVDFTRHSDQSLGGMFIVHPSRPDRNDKVSTASVLIQNCAQTATRSSEIDNIADIVEEVNDLQYWYYDNYVTRFSILENLGRILLNVEFEANDDLLIVNRKAVKLLSSSFNNENPVIGFKFIDSFNSSIKPVRFDEKNHITGWMLFGVVLSDSFVSPNSRLSASVFNSYVSPFPGGTLLKERQKPGYWIARKIGVQLTLKLANENEKNRFLKDEDAFFDVYLSTTADDRNLKTRVAVWDVETNDWSKDFCYKLRSKRDSKDVYRCNKFTEAGLEYIQTKFMVYKSPYNLRDFFIDNQNLTIFIIVDSCLSFVALLCIVLSAAMLKQWRNLGNKILLHMTTALTLNLTFGFLSHFLSVDTSGIPCIAIGAVRHYSYLAMFAWMLVLSSLQLVRLLTVTGARTTTYLLLKVTAFAWGVPLLVVGVLLSWDVNWYRSVELDRGYCYPEKLTFKVSVQGPAGSVLLINTVFFAVILARVYACCGWGVTDELQRHGISMKTLHWRRLRNSFFIFFLFGLSWTFHLLAEQRVIRNKFLYEYLCLLTASTHICMLALFFVVLDEKTRNGWKERLRWRWCGRFQNASCCVGGETGVTERDVGGLDKRGDITSADMSTFQRNSSRLEMQTRDGRVE